jgi:hypothetical protein
MDADQRRLEKEEERKEVRGGRWEAGEGQGSKRDITGADRHVRRCG